jgi:hypothetical protein
MRTSVGIGNILTPYYHAQRELFPFRASIPVSSCSALRCGACLEPPSTSDKVHDAAAARLRVADQRYTSGRRELVELLAVNRSPRHHPRPAGSAAQAHAELCVSKPRDAGGGGRGAEGGEQRRSGALRAGGRPDGPPPPPDLRQLRTASTTSSSRRAPSAASRPCWGTPSPAIPAFALPRHRLDVVGTCADCN